MRLRQAAAAATMMLFAVAASAQTDYCKLPGELMSEDATGDAVIIVAPDPLPGHDVLQTYVAEVPSPDGIERISFTIKVNRLAELATPLSSYQVEFMTEDSVERFALYTPYPTPVAVFSGQDLMFAYGHNEVGAGGTSNFVIDGEAEAESNAAADGTITIVLRKDAIAPDGGLLTSVSGVSQLNLMGSGTLDVDSSDAAGTYEVRGSSSCGASKAGILGVGGFSPEALAGLMLLGGLSLLARRRQPARA